VRLNRFIEDIAFVSVNFLFFEEEAETNNSYSVRTHKKGFILLSFFCFFFFYLTNLDFNSFFTKKNDLSKHIANQLRGHYLIFLKKSIKDLYLLFGILVKIVEIERKNHQIFDDQNFLKSINMVSLRRREEIQSSMVKKGAVIKDNIQTII